MKHVIAVTAVAVTLAIAPSAGFAQTGHQHVPLHVSQQWEDCAFQLDASLTKEAWHQFAKEAGLVTYFRPLRDAAPLGAGNFEISMIQSKVGIDDDDAAWNDTFVHPDSTHELFEGSGLSIPGFTARAGVTDRLDVGVYFTKNPKSNYGVAGGQVQYNFLRKPSTGIDASARASVVTLFGPDDVDVNIYHADVLTSKQFALLNRVSVSPYVGVSGYLTNTHEKSSLVSLADERVTGLHAMAGAVLKVLSLRVAVEYDAASVQSTSMKIGFAF